MSRNSRKRKFSKLLKQFKHELKPFVKDNPSMCMAFLNQYTSWKHRRLASEIRYYTARREGRNIQKKRKELLR